MPWLLGAEYRHEVGKRLTAEPAPQTITEADFGPLPDPVQRYLRVSGSVGQPRVDHFKATWRGRIRATARDPWMEFTAEQHNFVHEPARFFLMHASRGGLPVAVLHAFRDHSASMRVRLLSLIPLVNARGPDVTRAETVTLLNDLCLLAPSAMVDPVIRWEPIDTHSARAHYTVGANTVSAVLVFNDAGELVNFVSDDRLMASPDGKTFTRMRWSTPVGDYRSFGTRRVMTRGEGHWHAPGGEFSYLEIALQEFEATGVGADNPVRFKTT